MIEKEQNSRTIKEILDYETGEIISSNMFFSKDQDEIVKIRYLQEEAKHKRGVPKFICFCCLEVLEIRGGTFGSKEKIFFFNTQ